jgi:putative ABC transport system permease protein
MTGLYAEYYRFPFLSYRTSPPVFFGAAALAFGAAALGAIGGAWKAVRLSPAVAMSPPPPPVYRTGSVERFGQKAGFTTVGHMIVRHVARWPGRSGVTVLGVALSVGLLFATMQFLDSSRTMIDSFFLRGQRQDLTVTFIEPRNNDALHALRQVPGVLQVEPTRALAVKLSHGNMVERTAIESVVPGSRLTARIDADGSEIELQSAGLMLSRQLADQLTVKAGDGVLVQVLGGRRTEAMLPVVRIVDEFIGARAYADEATLESLARDAAPVGAALLGIDPAMRDSVLRELKDMPVVLGVTERDASVRLFEQMITDNLYTMLFFYISFAAAIAVGVVYNSARILFAEREHELATLRVLGFYRSEVGTVLLGELALLIAASVIPGCLIGYWMAQLMTEMFSSDLFRLPFAPSRASYGWSIVIVMLASATTAFLVALRVLRLDMVEVLKARD